MLFAESGSTVIGGRHFQDFNYLCAAAQVKIIRFGRTGLFDSSIRQFELPILADSDDIGEIYETMLRLAPHLRPEAIVFAPTRPIVVSPKQTCEITPYLYPEIAYRRALAFAAEDATKAQKFTSRPLKKYTVYRNEGLTKQFPGLETIDEIAPGESYAELTARIAERHKSQAKSVFFGDPATIFVRIPEEVARKSIPLFAPIAPKNTCDIQYSAYMESQSQVVDLVSKLAQETGDRVIYGRQTGDGDILRWSESGVSIQIVDPNRPAFPVISALPQAWSPPVADPDEISDDQLRQWADEGKILNTLIWHSGETAHNEAMVNLLELASRTGLKMGIGVHAQRYESCPQLWELLNVPRQSGGCAELIEPLLHAGGLGILAEINFPHDILRDNIRQAQERIRQIAGDANVPRGYYAFLDSDPATHTQMPESLWQTIAEENFDYIISSSRPGRNQILAQFDQCAVLNQTCQVVHPASPFVRITTPEDWETAPFISPGWVIGTLDAPVIAFDPYIWSHGSRFMQLVNRLLAGTNVKPSVIARYAKILREKQFLPKQK